eukprot:g45193.t1
MKPLVQWLQSNQDGRCSLQKQNPLASDGAVVFHQEKRSYTLQKRIVVSDGEQIMQVTFPGSVTAFVKSFFPAFDADLVSERCARDRGVQVQEVLKEWDDAREAGTTMHAYIESVYNGVRIPQQPWESGPEFVQFEKFKNYINETKGWIAFRTELILYSERYMVAGSCDIVFLDPTTGAVYICDWKRCKRIYDQPFGGRNGWGPCNDLPDCNLSHSGKQWKWGSMSRLRKGNRFIADEASVGSTGESSGSESSDNEQGSIGTFIQEEVEGSDDSCNHRQVDNKQEEEDNKALEADAHAWEQELKAHLQNKSGDDVDDSEEDIVEGTEAKEGLNQPNSQGRFTSSASSLWIF